MPAYLRSAGDEIRKFLVALLGVALTTLALGVLLFILALLSHLFFDTPLTGILPESNGPYRTITGAHWAPSLFLD